MKLEFHPEAEEEFLAALSHYEAELPGLGLRFDAELHSATDLLGAYPEIGAPLEGELRKLILDRFPFYLIYSVIADTVYVVAVAHERRKPGYWQQRIRA